jgi:hypothetical protein
MNSPPKEKRPAETGRTEMNTENYSSIRVLQVLCLIAQSQNRIESRLDELTALAQQRNDLLRKDRW